MIMQFVSSVETKTALDNPSRKGSDGGNWLQMVHECEAERLGSEEGEGRGSVARDPDAVAIGGAPTAHKRKKITLLLPLAEPQLGTSWQGILGVEPAGPRCHHPKSWSCRRVNNK